MMLGFLGDSIIFIFFGEIVFWRPFFKKSSSLTLKFPVSAKTCVGLASVELSPSPKSHLKASTSFLLSA